MMLLKQISFMLPKPDIPLVPRSAWNAFSDALRRVCSGRGASCLAFHAECIRVNLRIAVPKGRRQTCSIRPLYLSC